MWTDGHDTDIVRVTRYRPDVSVARTIDNYVGGAFMVSEPITDHVVQYGYDGEGRVITTTVNYDPATLGSRTDTNRTTVTAYVPTTGRIEGTRDPLGTWTSEQYDVLGRATAAIENCRDATGVPAVQGCAPFDPTNAPDRNVPVSNTRYDALGHAFETVDALGHVTHTVYDGLGRAVSTIDNYVAGGPTNADTNVTSQTAYDALGRTIVTTDAVGARTSYGYDALGQTVAVTDALGRVISAGYDGTGVQRWEATPNGRLTVVQIDGMGREIATISNYRTGVPGPATPPDQDLTSRTVYDAAGRRVQTVDPAGRVTAYGYDLMDHPTWIE